MMLVSILVTGTAIMTRPFHNYSHYSRVLLLFVIAIRRAKMEIVIDVLLLLRTTRKFTILKRTSYIMMTATIMALAALAVYIPSTNLDCPL